MAALSKGISRYPDYVKQTARFLHKTAGLSPEEISARLCVGSKEVVRRWIDDNYRLKANQQLRERRGQPMDPKDRVYGKARASQRAAMAVWLKQIGKSA